MSVISIENAYKTYRTGAVELTALKNVSLSVQKGEFTAIMGPSGSGKTTLMNILGCLDRIDEGIYSLGGQNITDMEENELAHLRNKEIGFIFQSFNLLPRLNVLDNVELPMIYAQESKKVRKEKALAALSQVGLMPWKEHRPNEISGGQKQRVAIARAIVNEPSIILADEPTGNLDSKSAQDIMRILHDLNENGATILLITHDQTMAEHARRIVRLYDGEVQDDVLQGGYKYVT